MLLYPRRIRRGLIEATFSACGRKYAIDIRDEFVAASLKQAHAGCDYLSPTHIRDEFVAASLKRLGCCTRLQACRNIRDEFVAASLKQGRFSL